MLYAITVVVFIHIWVYHHVLEALYRSNNPAVFPFHRIYPGYPIYFRKRKLCHIFFEIIKKAVVYLRPFTSVQIDNRYIPIFKKQSPAFSVVLHLLIRFCIIRFHPCPCCRQENAKAKRAYPQKQSCLGQPPRNIIYPQFIPDNKHTHRD